VLHGAFSTEECEQLTDKADRKGFKPVPKTGGGAASRQNRNNARVTFDDDELAQEIWLRVAPYLESDLSRITSFENTSYVGSDPTAWKVDSICERMRFYRYDKGEFFNPHMDGSLRREVTRDGKEYIQQTFVSLMLYLNDEFKGGETEFFVNESKMVDLKHKFSITPKCGMIAIFPHENLHRSIPLVSGRKYVLRTDVLYIKERPTNLKLAKFQKDKANNALNKKGEWTKLFHPSCKNYQSE